MGKVRAPLLRAHPHAVILWVVDVSEASGKPMAADHDCASFTTDIRVALADERVDLVWVTTPTFAHLDVIKRSAAAGRCIFTEKPVAEEPFAIRDAFAAAEACGVALYCGFQRRFDSGYARVRELVAAGKIGKVNFIRVCFADSPAPPIEFMLKGGCPFLDLAPHDIDWIRWTLNEEPTSVYAIGSSSSPALAAAGVLDAATMTLSFASGAVAQIVMTRRSAYGYDNRVEVIGELGKLEVSTPPKTSVVHASAAGIATDVLQFSFPQRFHDAFAAEVDAAVRCVCDRKKYAALGLALGADAATWPITFRDCIMAQTVAMAAARSQKLGAPLAISAPVPCSAAIPSADQRVALRPIGNGGFGAYIHALVQRDARLRAHFDVGAPYTRSSGLEWERDVLASAQLEAVYVCSPDALHRTHAMECLNAGLHVLVEKPVRMDGDAPFNERHFNDVADVALAKKRVVMVGLHRRFDAEFMRLRAEVRRRWAARSAFAVHIESRDPCPAESDDKAQFVLYNSCASRRIRSC
jgi:myo-inositol 2-dehydrogenase/D-chiro-inositol 1-dehydrogenase